MFSAKERGEHVYFTWRHNFIDGCEDEVIVDSDEVETLDDVFMLLFGRTVEEDNAHWEEWFRSKQEKKEKYQRFVEENYDSIVESANDLFPGDEDKIRYWANLCARSKDSQYAFQKVLDSLEVLRALKEGFEPAIL